MSNPISLPPNLALDTNNTQPSKSADVQVTSSDILQGANQIRQSTFKRPKQTIQDLDELRSFQLAKRKEYEQQLNKNRLNFGQWMRYAKWEIDHNHDFKRARSIMERALEVNVQHVPFWVRYIEIELLHKNVNHARNLLDRAVTTLPRTDKLWFMYVQTEESLANYRGVRSVFERWLTWKPPRPVWESYIAFEQRYDEFENVRNIYTRYVAEFPGESHIWLRWANFEVSGPSSDSVQIARIRGVFESGIDVLAQHGTLDTDENLVSYLRSWTTWEVSVREVERARAIYKLVLDSDLITKVQKAGIFQDFSEFETKYGAVGGDDDTLRLKRSLQYEKDLAEDPQDYDSWWEYIKLQEAAKPADEVVDLLQKSVQTTPSHKKKSTLWRRYVFLWIKLAWLQELTLLKVDDARTTWKQSLDVIARQGFSFAKLWILYSEFELRNSKDGLSASRKILGKAIGQTSKNGPKHKVFKHYIALEKSLGEWSRVRRLYEKWLELALVWDLTSGNDASVTILKEYVEFERSLEESDRCIGIYEAVIDFQRASDLDVDGYIASFIEYLKDEMLYERARGVYRDWLASSPKPNVWISFALFESQILSPEQLDELEAATSDEVQFRVEEYHTKATRKVFNEAFKFYRDKNDSEDAIRILDAWKDYEEAHGTESTLQNVSEKFPTTVRKRRTVDGVEEVYVEYVFPQSKPDVSKFLANAKKWALKSG